MPVLWHVGIPILDSVLMHTAAPCTPSRGILFRIHVCVCLPVEHIPHRIYNQELQKWKFPASCTLRKRNAFISFFWPFYPRKNTRGDITRTDCTYLNGLNKISLLFRFKLGFSSFILAFIYFFPQGWNTRRSRDIIAYVESGSQMLHS
jgi:hypothetical protein